jgi:hypothetical protein
LRAQQTQELDLLCAPYTRSLTFPVSAPYKDLDFPLFRAPTRADFPRLARPAQEFDFPVSRLRQELDSPVSARLLHQILTSSVSHVLHKILTFLPFRAPLQKI